MATKALNYTTAEINQRLNLAGTAVQPNALNDYYTKTEVDGKVVVDLSTRYSTSYANLSAALTVLNNNTSTDATAIKKGGVSVKFINSTTNKYEQWNLKASSWSTNISDWGNTNVTDASEVKYGNGNVKDALDNAVSKTNGISKEFVQSEEEAIIYETDGGTQIGKIDANGADFTNLKRGGQQVARMSDLPTVPTLDTSIGSSPSDSHTPSTKAVKDYVDAKQIDLPITEETTASEDEEMEFTNNTGSQSYAKVGSYGMKSKAYLDLEGREIGEYRWLFFRRKKTTSVSGWTVIMQMEFSIGVTYKIDITSASSLGTTKVVTLKDSTYIEDVGDISGTNGSLIFTPTTYANKLQIRTSGDFDVSVYRLVKQQKRHPVISVAHQGFDTTGQSYGNSRLSSVQGAWEQGFDWMETDLVFASDGVPMCCHDETFVDGISGNTITISEHTSVELQENYEYYGETIATFEEVVARSKYYGLKVAIDHTYILDTQQKYNTISNIVKKYNMLDRVMWSVSTGQTDLISWILAENKSAILNLSVTTLSSNYVTFAENILTDNPLATVIIYVSYMAGSNTPADFANYAMSLSKGGIKFGAWTLDTDDLFADYSPYVSYITSNCISCTNTIK